MQPTSEKSSPLLGCKDEVGSPAVDSYKRHRPNTGTAKLELSTPVTGKGSELAKVWVLDTQTKGTGATMVPLERVLHKSGSEAVPGFVFPKRKPLPSESPERKPRLFKLVDVMTRRVLGEDVDARAAVILLEDVRSIVDVEIFVWEPKSERWRMLTFGEARALWDYREDRDEPARDDETGPSEG